MEFVDTVPEVAPQKLLQDVALVHLEEWLHGLQHLVGKPLAGYENKELDVTTYLLKQGVSLTDNFLSRHGRSKHFPSVHPTHSH